MQQNLAKKGLSGNKTLDQRFGTNLKKTYVTDVAENKTAASQDGSNQHCYGGLINYTTG